MYTLEQLRGFVAVAEYLHFGRAAESLQMTQPPLSRQIQKLEADLGVELFARTNRQVALTAAGAELLERARHILTLSDLSRAAVRSVAHGERGTLTIGFTATSALSVLGPVLERIHGALPDVDIDLREGVTSAQLAEIDRGRIDLGLLRSAPADEYGVRELLREDLVVVVPVDHPLAKRGKPCTVDQIAEYPMIGYTQRDSGYFHRKIEWLMGERPVHVAYRVTQILSMLSLVRRGLGIALVPQSTYVMRPEGIRFLELAVPARMAAEAQVSLSAVWSKESRNPALRRALEVLDGVLDAF
ncbi:LysR family transcriptional regulator [Microbacterium soli]|uniref:LysR substrate-binding domain-containing protein n=1 Tax=Microbacterium soli TaxID=446075 RepID=A0ABP7N4F9_9MICO